MRRECVHLDALSFPRRKNTNLIKLLKIYLHQALTSVWARDTHKSDCTRGIGQSLVKSGASLCAAAQV